MSCFKSVLRWITPNGLVERHRRNFRMGKLGLPGSLDIEEAVHACRYDLWPIHLRRASTPWTLVDVGANVGEFSAAAARRAGLACIHAIEPQPACHDALARALKDVPESRLHSVAVGRESGSIELLCTANTRMASVLPPDQQVAAAYNEEDFTVENRIEVPMRRIDDLIPEGTPIGLLKMDVQGFEIPAIEGARRTLMNTSTILMEVNYVPHYKGGATFDELHAAVRSLGFRTHAVSTPYTGPDGPMWADAVFVRE